MKKSFGPRCLVLLMLVSLVLAGCGQTAENNPQSDTPAESPAAAEQEAPVETEPVPDLPEKTMNGKEFNISTSGWYNFAPLEMNDLIRDEMTGEVLNDAVFTRMTEMESKYDCKIRQGDEPDQAQQITMLARNVMASDNAFDFCLFRTYSYVNAVTSNIFVDLTSVPYINMEKPWWDKQSYDSLALSGRHFVAASDITINDELSIFCIFFNKDMRVDHSLENPYDLVKNGTWTYDKLFSMGATVSNDVNGNGKVDSEDHFGMTHTLDAVNGMLNSMDVKIAENNPDQTQSFTFTSEQNITKILYLYEHLFNWNEVYNVHKYGVAEEGMFVNGNVLFMASGVYMNGALRDMENEFGILPYPKYDEAQPNYLPSNNTFCMTVMGVLKTNPDPENTGIFLEDFAYEGYKNVRPAFYEQILQHKVARDNESAEILDEIFGNVTYDIGGICNFNGFAYDLCFMTINGDTDLSSFIASKKSAAEEKMNEVLDLVKGFE